MTGILLSLIPLFTWGIGDYVASRLSKHHPVVVNFGWSIVFLSYALVLTVLFGYELPSLNIMLAHIFAAIMLNGGFMIMLKAFSTGAVGVVSPIANAYGVITALGSLVILDVKISGIGWLAIGIITAGIAMLSYKKGASSHPQRISTQTIVYSVVALVMFGIGFMMFDVATQSQEWHQGFIVFSQASVFVSGIIFLLFTRSNRLNAVKSILTRKLLYIGALTSGSGTVAIFAAIQSVGNATIPAVVSAASPLVTSFLAFSLDKEQLSILQRAGAVVVVAGIMLLSL